MNIFHLSDCPVKSAQWLHDKHVVKMTLETAQLLSQAIRLTPAWLDVCPDVDELRDDGSSWNFASSRRPSRGLYGVTHHNHPSAKWTRLSSGNFAWLCRHGIALCDEYTERYGKRHKSRRIINAAVETAKRLPSEPLTPFAMAMPLQYKQAADFDPVLAYRFYYLTEKCQQSAWKRRDHLPSWLLPYSL